MEDKVEKSQSRLLRGVRLMRYRAWLRAECLVVGHAGQVLAPTWPGAGGGRWVKALDERDPRPWGSGVALRDSLCC